LAWAFLPGSLSTCTSVSSPCTIGASSSASRSRLITGCTAAPTRTTLAASVLRDQFAPPKRPSNVVIEQAQRLGAVSVVEVPGGRGLQVHGMERVVRSM